MARICSPYICIHKTSPPAAGDRVTVSRASANVQLTITSLCLRLADLDTGRALHQVGVLLSAAVTRMIVPPSTRCPTSASRAAATATRSTTSPMWPRTGPAAAPATCSSALEVLQKFLTFSTNILDFVENIFRLNKYMVHLFSVFRSGPGCDHHHRPGFRAEVQGVPEEVRHQGQAAAPARPPPQQSPA